MDTRNAVRARVRFVQRRVQRPCNSRWLSQIRPGIIIRVSGVRVPPPASRKSPLIAGFSGSGGVHRPLRGETRGRRRSPRARSVAAPRRSAESPGEEQRVLGLCRADARSRSHRASRAQRGSAHLAADGIPRECVEEGRHGGFDPQTDFGAQVRRGLRKGDVCVECESGVEGEFVASGAGGDAGDDGGKPSLGLAHVDCGGPDRAGRLSGVRAGR